jgi:lipoate-protein ligase A
MGFSAEFAFHTGGAYTGTKRASREETNFCLASNEKYDIIIDGKKIGGNAQKRTRRALFQHGSIPLRNTLTEAGSFLKEDVSLLDGRVHSLAEAAGRTFEAAEVEALIQESFIRTFDRHLEKGPLTMEEQESAVRLRRYKYDTLSWNFQRFSILDEVIDKQNTCPHTV